jgi:hypothetical protein
MGCGGNKFLTERINLVHTSGIKGMDFVATMKTAISIQEPLLKEVKVLAEKMAGWSMANGSQSRGYWVD